jgi:hypothetical protein
MTRKTKIQQIKLFIKISIVVCVLFIFVVLGFFVKPIRTFEKSNMKKWLTLSEQERITTVQRVVPNAENQDLLINCITKIAKLPDSNEMIIHDATVLCYNGIKLSSNQDEKEEQ